MATLDLYKDRIPHIILMEIDGKEVQYKIPMSYTVEEVERLLEHQAVLDRIAAEETVKGKEDEQVGSFFDALFNQVLVLFKRYQPDITVEFLKKHLTREEVSQIISFYTNEQLHNVGVKAGVEQGKKKVQEKS